MPQGLPTLLLTLILAMLPPTSVAAISDGGQPWQNDAWGVCAEFPERCGASVVLGPDYAGVNNCDADPSCVTRRIVHRGTGYSDAIPVDLSGVGERDEPEPVTVVHPPTAAPSSPAAPSAPSDPGCVVVPVTGPVVSLPDGGLPSDGVVGVSPHREQLVGLESWLWWEGPVEHRWDVTGAAGRAADCSPLEAPVVQAEASLVEWRWRVEEPGGGVVTRRVDRAGSEEAPALRLLFESVGEASVSVECVWEGHGDRRVLPCGDRRLDVLEVRTRLHQP